MTQILPAEHAPLTPSGWPRPLNSEGLPVPWVSPASALGVMNTARYNSCATGAVCAVCGLSYDIDEPAFILVNSAPEQTPADLAAMEVAANDNAVLHARCLGLALARCPSLQRQEVAGGLTVVRVSAALDAKLEDSQQDDDDRLQAVYEGEGCTIIGSPADFRASCS